MKLVRIKDAPHKQVNDADGDRLVASSLNTIGRFLRNRVLPYQARTQVRYATKSVIEGL